VAPGLLELVRLRKESACALPFFVLDPRTYSRPWRARCVGLDGGPDVDVRYVSSPEAGTFPVERPYRGGRSYDWREALRRASGGALAAAAFVEELATVA